MSPNRQKHFKASLIIGLAFIFYSGCQNKLPVWYQPYQPLQNRQTKPHIYAQEELDTVYVKTINSPSYPGGMSSWMNYIMSNIQYPSQARLYTIEGNVFLSFDVKKTGEIKNVIVTHSIGYGCDKEAVRLLLNSGLWNPGELNGQTVNSRSRIRVVFNLTD